MGEFRSLEALTLEVNKLKKDFHCLLISNDKMIGYTNNYLLELGNHNDPFDFISYINNLVIPINLTNKHFIFYIKFSINNINYTYVFKGLNGRYGINDLQTKLQDWILIEVDNSNNFSSLLQKQSGENIPSHTPIAIIDNLAYKLDASNPNHKFAFVGFSTNGTLIGETCLIKEEGEIILAGWGLIPNSQYLASDNGLITLNNTNLNNFTKVIGYALDSNTLYIIKDYTTLLT